MALVFVFPGHLELIMGAAVALAGAGKLVVGHLETGENDALPPASRAFRELADPGRPLGAGDPLSLHLPPAGAPEAGSTGNGD